MRDATETWPLRAVGGKAEKQEREESEHVALKEGAVLTDTEGEKFVLEKKLGEGGMGGVFKVKSERTGMEQAIKFINAELRYSPEIMKRFEREIKVLAQMKNPFIVAAHDVREFDLGREKVLGLITEFVEGETLHEKIQKEHGLKSGALITIAAEIAFALESLRKAGIVHRDLKPANVFLQPIANEEPVVRLGDFGIAGFAFESELADPSQDPFYRVRQERVTHPGTVSGTPEYITPEAVTEGGKVDHRSDLYSLGVVMYEMATGNRPFDKRDTMTMIRAHQNETPAPINSSEGPQRIPPWIENIILKLLQKNPNDRYQSAAELFQELKKGVTKHYPELLNEIPFIWNIKPESESYDDASTKLAA